MIKSMNLARSQRGSQFTRRPDNTIVPLTDGNTALCENLRERADGCLQAVYPPIVIANSSHNIVFADRRGNATFLFSMSDNAELTIFGKILDDNSFCQLNISLHSFDNKSISSAAAMGEFLVFALNDGELFFLLWNPDLEVYSVLGNMPQPPQFDAFADDIISINSPVLGTTFKEPVSDFRSEIPQHVISSVGKNVIDAWNNAVDSANNAHRWSQPVAVRLAVKLWDGSILNVSKPQIVALPDGGYSGYDRINIPLSGSVEEGFYATDDTALSINAFKIKIDIKNWDLAMWEAVVRGIDVWITPMQNPINDNLSPDFSQYVNNGTYSLSAFLPYANQSDLANELVRLLPYSHSLIPNDSISFFLDFNPNAEKNIIDRNIFANTPSKGNLKANLIFGHGDFLHLAQLSETFPKPTLESWHFASETTTDAVAIVNFKGKLTGKSTAANISLKSLSLTPIISYPSADADSVTITLRANDKIYFSKLPLTPDANGADFAYYISPNLLPIELTESTEIPFPIVSDTALSFHNHTAIATSSRGNPFTISDRTNGIGGGIFAIAAQSEGGGAYTRQFIYLFTDKGISALTHKADGSHSNCRPISSEIISNPDNITNSSAGVFAMSDNGCLLRINDAKNSQIIRNLPGCRRLAWTSKRNELWLISDDAPDGWNRSLVLQLDFDYRAFTSSIIPLRLISSSGNPIFSNKNNDICMLDESSDRQNRLQQIWISNAHPVNYAGPTILSAKIFGQNAEAIISAKYANIPDNDSAVALWTNSAEHHPDSSIITLSISGNISSPINQPILLLRNNSSPLKRFYLSPSIRFGATGYFDSLTDINLYKP